MQLAIDRRSYKIKTTDCSQDGFTWSMRPGIAASGSIIAYAGVGRATVAIAAAESPPPVLKIKETRTDAATTTFTQWHPCKNRQPR